MDILAHGLWTNAVYALAARKKKKERTRREVWIAIFFGVFPDLFAFGLPLVIGAFTGNTLLPYAHARLNAEWSSAPHWLTPNHSLPNPAFIPAYVYELYNLSHSMVLFLLIFFLVWIYRKSPYWLAGGWGLHIAIDVFSHNEKFFPTPIFYPLSRFHISGVSWADPVFMLGNYSLLLATYLYLYPPFHRRKKNLD